MWVTDRTSRSREAAALPPHDLLMPFAAPRVLDFAILPQRASHFFPVSESVLSQATSSHLPGSSPHSGVLYPLPELPILQEANPGGLWLLTVALKASDATSFILTCLLARYWKLSSGAMSVSGKKREAT